MSKSDSPVIIGGLDIIMTPTAVVTAKMTEKTPQVSPRQK